MLFSLAFFLAPHKSVPVTAKKLSEARAAHARLVVSSLVQRGHRLPGFDLIQAEGEGEAAGQLLDAAHVR